MATDPLESKRLTEANAALLQAMAAVPLAERAQRAAKNELDGLDRKVRTNIGAWTLDGQKAERERLTWQYNVACANHIGAKAAVTAARSEVKAAKAAWHADPAAREAAAQRYVEVHRQVNDLLATLRDSITELGRTNKTWQDMSVAQQPEVYGRYAPEGVADGQRASDLMWLLNGRGDMFPEVPFMSREAAKTGVTVPAA